MLRDAQLHRGRDPQRHMHPAEVIEREMQGDGGPVVGQPLTVGVRAARMATGLGAYGKERATDIIDWLD